MTWPPTHVVHGIDPHNVPANLIYGLIDPRTRFIRYIGLSSQGLIRPKNHAQNSCPDTYCRRWVKSLQRQNLSYEIVVLETLSAATALADAERWWIAFGRACGWPLTNLTDGRGPSVETILERQRRRTAWEDAEAKRLQAKYSQSHIEAHCLSLSIPAEIEKQCFRFFDFTEHFTPGRGGQLVDDVIANIQVTRVTAILLYKKWLRHRTQRSAKEDIRQRCAELFDNGTSLKTALAAMPTQARLVKQLYKKWMRQSHDRGKRALEKDREALRQQLVAARSSSGREDG